jgi:hypothetical protein
LEILTATDGHPFWVPDLEEWVPAGELQRGDWLRTGSGSWVQVQSIKIRTASQRVHNLTVDDLHTYHVVAGETPVLVHNCNPLYSELDGSGRAGVAYAEVSPQTLDDAAAEIIGSRAGRGNRYKPAGFGGDAAGHSRGHLIARQFGGSGRDLRNLVTQGKRANNGRISDLEDAIAAHVRNSGNSILMSVTPEYSNGGVVPSHILIEAVDGYGWSVRERIPNL